MRVALQPGIKNPKRAGLAWAVHLFTASGIVLGFLAVVAGFLARKANVLEYTPNVDGRTLDNVIDFFNYVAVPALMIYWFGMVPDWLGVFTAAAIMAVSCYTFANMGIKSEDYYFVGFPAVLWVWIASSIYFAGISGWRSLQRD